jgi:3',5'-cyclic AMP phosphodiesterase CpdA
VQAVVLGDTGSGSAAQIAIAQRLAEHPFELMVFLGDVAYPRGTAERLDARFFGVYADYLAYVPVFPTLGNHDEEAAQGRAYLDAFVLPGEERWYSFDWGDAHFVVLDTNRIGPEQARWLDRDLASSERRWLIVAGHHPPLTTSIRGGSSRYNRFLVPVLERYRIDLLLAGHEHHYERFGPLRNGMHLIVSGGGGGNLQNFGWNSDAAALRLVHHFLSLTITENELVVRAIDIEGKEFDRLSLRK